MLPTRFIKSLGGKTLSRKINRMPNFFYVDSTLSRGNALYQSPFTRIFGTASRYPGASSYLSAQRTIWTVIGINTIVFGAWTYARSTRDVKLLGMLQRNFTISRPNWEQGRWWTLVTSAFSHQAPAHFLFNMMSFRALAGILSMIPGIGAFHICVLGLGSAVVGSGAWLYQSMQKPGIRGFQSALGASGLVMGIGSAAACLTPYAPMHIMFIPVAVSLWTATLGFAAVDILFLGSDSPIGHAAHLGGGIFGVMYYFARLRSFGGVWDMIIKRQRGIRRR